MDLKQVLISFSAFAFAITPATADVVDLYLENYTVSPDPGTVESIHEITIVFPDAPTTSPDFGISPTITLPDGSSVACSGKSQTNYDGRWVGYQFYFQDTYTVEGNYFVVIPEGAVKCEAELSPRIELSYTISGSDIPAVVPEDFTEGIIMLNEDWFGHNPSSMNYIAPDGTVTYNAYKTVNEGLTLGNTSQYGQVFGNRIFVTSKQNYGETGGRLISMDATTLKFLGQIMTLPCGDGRGFCAATADKGYIGGSTGFYAVDLNTLEITSEQLAPAGSNGRYTQSGDMVRYGDYVFVAQQNIGVVAVKIATDETKVIELPKICGFAITPDGTLYAACNDNDAEFVAIDPVTLETRIVNIEGSHAISSPWGTWHAASIAADTKKNVVYYVSGGGWTIKTIVSYNFDTNEFNDNYYTCPDDQCLYGAGLGVDPVSGNLVLSLKKNGWGDNSLYNWVGFVDTNDGTVLKDKTIALTEQYWFPAMFLFNNFTAPEINAEALTLAAGENTKINLADATTLETGNANLIIYSATSSDENVFTITRDANGEYTVDAVAAGCAEIMATADYQGRCAEVKIPVTVSSTTGIEPIAKTPMTADVYTPSGIFVLRNATAEQIRTLAPGIYISAGRKILVK